MNINYEIRLYTAKGDFLTSITDIIDAGGAGLDYVLRSDGQIGALNLSVPRGDLDVYFPWKNVDYKIGVWRSINGAPYALDNNAMFFVRSFEYTESYTKVTAYHALELLTRRLNAYRKSTFNNWGPQQTSWGGTAVETDAMQLSYAGNLMKGIVRQNYSFEYQFPDNDGTFGLFNRNKRWNYVTTTGREMGSGSWLANIQLPNMDLQEYILIEPDKNDGIWTAAIDCNGGVVYELLKQIQALSIQGDEDDNVNPIYLTFDLQSVDERTFIFKTFQSVYGTNRGNGNFIFSAYRGNLAEPKMIVDRSEESTVMYSIDKNENIKAAINRRRLVDSPFNLREALSNPQIKESTYARKVNSATNPRDITSAQALINDAHIELLRKMPRIKIEGKAVPTPTSIRGRDWDVGDIVTLDFRGFRDDYRISAVNVSISNGQITEDVQWEQIDISGFGGDTSDEISQP